MTGNDTLSVITTAFTGHTGEPRTETVSGGMLIEGDTKGGKTADLVIFVAGATSVATKDFPLQARARPCSVMIFAKTLHPGAPGVFENSEPKPSKASSRFLRRNRAAPSGGLPVPSRSIRA